jgi:hypothetical protein
VCYNTITQAKEASVAEVSPVKTTGEKYFKNKRIMSKKNWLLVSILTALLVVAVILLTQNSMERSFNSFHNEMLDLIERKGELGFEGDSVFYSFLPPVGFSIAERGYLWTWDNSDNIRIVTREGAEYRFARSMRNWNGIPNPGGNGKHMEKWRECANPHFSKEDKKIALATFKRVVKNNN